MFMLLLFPVLLTNTEHLLCPDLALTAGSQGRDRDGFHFHAGSLAPQPLCPRLKGATAARWEPKDPATFAGEAVRRKAKLCT